MSMIPLVGVVPQREFAGWDGGSQVLTPVTVCGFGDALQRRWPTAALLTQYQVVSKETKLPYVNENGEPHWFRINKGAGLDEVRRRGGDIAVTLLAFDWDTEGHRPWAEGQYDELVNLVLSFAGKEYDLPSRPTAFFATRHGARWIYKLKYPISAERAEGISRGILRDFKTVGLNLDPKCWEWNRLFLLPSVVRDGVPTWTEGYFDFNFFPENVLDPDQVAPEENTLGASYAPVEKLDLQMPTQEEARALLFEPATVGKRLTMSAWHLEARKRLIGRECYDVAFNDALIAEKGHRMTRLHRLVGEACALLFGVAGSTPVHVQAILGPAAEQLEPDNATPDWWRACWEAVCRYWHKEQQKAEARKQERQAAESDAQTKLERVVLGMRQWCDRPELLDPDMSVACEWAREHLLLQAGATVFVMTPNGTYDKLPLLSSQVPSRVRELGMSSLIQFEVETDKGRKEVPYHKVLRRHATNVSRIIGSVDVPCNHVENIETNHATFRFRLFKRKTDLEPTHSRMIEDWLRSWFDLDEDYERLVDWIGNALAFEEGPIAALSIVGRPGIGKKLLAQGLAECVTGETYATEADFGSFNAGFLNSPFLVINEGLPGNQIGGRDVADIFRHYVSGDPIIVNEKYQKPMEIRNPVRVLCTANNNDMLSMLTGHRDLSPEDREAILMRILHLEVSRNASVFLRRLGGLSFTGAPGQRWIRSDAGAPGDYIVAKHFLYLYHTRKKPAAGSRLLVEGHMGETLANKMSTQSMSTPLVIEALVHMAESDKAWDGFWQNEDGLWVTTQSVMDAFANRSKNASRNLSVRGATSVLRSLTIRSEQACFKGHTARWYLLDQKMLIGCAIEQGVKCTKLMTKSGIFGPLKTSADP